MADKSEFDELPVATVVRRKRMRFSVIWTIPILAAAIAIGIAVQRARSEGPVINITFTSAHNIEAGKTFIKYKDVRIGLVTGVELSQDYSKVVVKAKIAKHSAGLMVEDANFWVVEPRISLSGVSGLNTLLSGNYIGFQAGNSSEEQSTFVGLEEPPTIMAQPGKRFTLKARSLGSLGVGDPVYYRGLLVGQLTAHTLVADGKSVELTAFVYSPYDKYVTSETRFWNASGIDVSVTADGVDIRTESLAALVAGGVAFDAPDYLPPVPPAAANTAFPLYRNRVIAMKQPDPDERRFVLYFNESVRGLSVGAPVTLYGLRVGEVAHVGLHYDSATRTFRPRVLITFFPDQVVGRMTARQQVSNGKGLRELDANARLRMLRQNVEERGLRAQLKTGSYLTGELFVAFEYFPHAPKPKLDWNKDPLELPVVAGGFANIEAKLGSILTKVDDLPLDAIGTEVKATLATLNQTMKDERTLVNNVDTKLLPDGTRTLDEMRRAIGSADRVLKNTDATLYGKDSPAPQDLRDTLQEVTRAARSVRILVDYLERHPEMLLRGKTEEKP